MLSRNLSISVIIPTRNRGPKVIGTIRSLLTNTSLPSEIIIVDASDKNESNKTISVYIKKNKKHTKIKYYKIAHKGIGYSLNYAIKRTSGNLISKIDDDETAPANWLTNIKLSYDQYPTIPVRTGPLRAAFPNNYWNQTWEQILKDTYTGIRHTNIVLGGNWVMNRAVFFQHALWFDSTSKYTGEDVYFSFLLQKNKISILSDSRLAVFHEFRTSMSGFFRQWFNYGVGDYHLYIKNHLFNSISLNNFPLTIAPIQMIKSWNTESTMFFAFGIYFRNFSYLSGFLWAAVKNHFIGQDASTK